MRTRRQIENAAFSPAQFPDHPKKGSGKRVVLIGANVQDDVWAVTILSQRLASFRSTLSRALSDKRRWDVYDMTTKPEKGDALDRLGDDVQLVVACHVPMHPITVTDRETLQRLKEYKHMEGAYFYNTRNEELFPWCMLHDVPLLAFGDQPPTELYRTIGLPAPDGKGEHQGMVVRESVLFEVPRAVLYEAGRRK